MTKPETTKLTIRLPRAQVEFAKHFARSNDITVTEVISRYLDQLRRQEVEELHPEVRSLVGIIPSTAEIGADTGADMVADLDAQRLADLTRKHLK